MLFEAVYLINAMVLPRLENEAQKKEQWHEIVLIWSPDRACYKVSQ
jgi:hypothetical protein